MAKVKHYRTPEEVLSPESLASMSPSASRLFTYIWNELRDRDATEVRLPDVKSSIRARILLKDLETVKRELAAGGYLHFRSSPKRAHVPDEVVTLYVLCEEQDANVA